MSFDIQITKQLGNCTIKCAIKTGAQLIALTGPSGQGKSSVLNCIAGLIRPDNGHIIVGGQTLFDTAQRIDIPTKLRGCGYVFQENRLFPHLTVEQNLRYGASRNAGSGQHSLSQIIDLLNISALLDRKPATLSGGEQRRVAIGRAVMSNPRIILLDEPLTSLDRGRGETILTIIDQLRRETDIPIVYVTHQMTEIERLGCPTFTLNAANMAVA